MAHELTDCLIGEGLRASGVRQAGPGSTRPDGKTQVTLNGAPVYRLVEDQSGQLGGDGLVDAFDG